MDLIGKSLHIALQAHAGQIDKAEQPYILHSLRTKEKMSTDEEQSISLLHDVLEDSEFTAKSLSDAGIPPI